MGGGAIPRKSPFPDSKSDEAVKDAWQLWREEFASVPQPESLRIARDRRIGRRISSTD
jgi:hypothetical protein